MTEQNTSVLLSSNNRQRRKRMIKVALQIGNKNPKEIKFIFGYNTVIVFFEGERNG